jgi:hypothetical protein
MVAPLRRCFFGPEKGARVEPGECLGDYPIIQGREQDVYILMIRKNNIFTRRHRDHKENPIITEGFPPL